MDSLKKILVVCACSGAVLCALPSIAYGDVPIDEGTFPDLAFRIYVENEFDADHSGVLEDGEIAAAKAVDVQNAGIATLQGIEHFTSLETLFCNRNPLVELRIEQNTLLETLDCSYCGLEKLDVSKNINVVNLFTTGNRLLELNVENNTRLQVLSVDLNKLTDLDVRANILLRNLQCSGNKLGQLDVSNNTDLKLLYCDLTGISSLDLSKCPEVVWLQCKGNRLLDVIGYDGPIVDGLEQAVNISVIPDESTPGRYLSESSYRFDAGHSFVPLSTRFVYGYDEGLQRFYTDTLGSAFLFETKFPTDKIAGTVTFEIAQRTVTFLDYEGTKIADVTVDYGSAATAPDAPEREGYTFIGWDTDFTHVTEDLTVTARYQKDPQPPTPPIPPTPPTPPAPPTPVTPSPVPIPAGGQAQTLAQTADPGAGVLFAGVGTVSASVLLLASRRRGKVGK